MCKAKGCAPLKHKQKLKPLISLMVFLGVTFLYFVHGHSYFSLLLPLLHRNCHHFKFFPLLACGV